MRRKKIFLLILAVIIMSAAAGYAIFSSAPQKNLDTFANCLAEKGLTMYGAAWCPHCQNEKAAFGASFHLVPYVECPDSPKLCLDKGIEGYPTWILPDGRKLVGEQGLQKLSAASGCPLP